MYNFSNVGFSHNVYNASNSKSPHSYSPYSILTPSFQCPSKGQWALLNNGPEVRPPPLPSSELFFGNNNFWLTINCCSPMTMTIGTWSAETDGQIRVDSSNQVYQQNKFTQPQVQALFRSQDYKIDIGRGPN